MMTRTRLTAVMLLAVPMLALGAGEARAHPFGVKPVLVLAPSAAGVNARWIAQPDEFRVLADHLGFGPVSPSRMAERDAFKTYFLGHLRIDAGGGSCDGQVLGATQVADGFVVAATYTCPGESDEVSVQMTMLQDIDDRYVNVLHATTDGTPVRGAFSKSVTTIDVAFSRATAVPAPAAEDGGSADRILASLQGAEGAAPFVAALGLAFVLGLLHGITPGHGKTIAAAYIVGAGGTMRQAFTLGGVVTATHAVSTGLIAAIPIALGHAQPPGGLSSWLEIAAGVLIVGFGAFMLRRPPHTHDHEHPDARAMPVRRLAGIGFVGGLVPNPEALLVVLVAFSIGRWTAGAALVAAFSVGLGLVVLGIAIAAVKGGGLVRRIGSGRLAVLAPRLAAFLFLAMGVAVAARGVVSL